MDRPCGAARPIVNPKPPTPTIDTANVQLVSARYDGEITVALPRTRMTREEALTFAAWLVTCADPGWNDFLRYLRAVHNHLPEHERQ